MRSRLPAVARPNTCPDTDVVVVVPKTSPDVLFELFVELLLLFAELLELVLEADWTAVGKHE